MIIIYCNSFEAKKFFNKIALLSMILSIFIVPKFYMGL